MQPKNKWHLFFVSHDVRKSTRLAGQRMLIGHVEPIDRVCDQLARFLPKTPNLAAMGFCWEFAFCEIDLYQLFLGTRLEREHQPVYSHCHAKNVTLAGQIPGVIEEGTSKNCWFECYTPVARVRD